MLAVRRGGERLSFVVPVTPVQLLAKALDVPPSAVRLERGAAARTKRVSVPSGAEAALRRLAK